MQDMYVPTALRMELVFPDHNRPVHFLALWNQHHKYLAMKNLHVKRTNFKIKDPQFKRSWWGNTNTFLTWLQNFPHRYLKLEAKAVLGVPIDTFTSVIYPQFLTAPSFFTLFLYPSTFSNAKIFYASDIFMYLTTGSNQNAGTSWLLTFKASITREQEHVMYS